MSAHPWNKISLADYEGHMATPGVGQAAMLARELQLALDHTRAQSLALVGCAGGNGLESRACRELERVVCVDINPDFLEVLRARYAQQLRNLECHCGAIESCRGLEPVNLVFGGLVFEYTRLGEALDSIARMLQAGGSLYAVLQMPAEGLATITPSPYAQALGAVVETFTYVPPRTLIALAAQRQLIEQEQRIIKLPSGKCFTLVRFKKTGDSP